MLAGELGNAMSEKHTVDNNSSEISPTENTDPLPLQGKENGALLVPGDKDQLPPKDPSNHVPVYKNGREAQHNRKKVKGKSEPKDSESKMRERLATWTIVLLFTLLIAYIYTRDLMLVGLETTVFGVVIFIVFRYYFSQEK